MTTDPTAEDIRTQGSPGQLLASVTSDMSDLMRQELALAKAEARQSVTRASSGAGMLAGAGVAGHFVLLFLSVAGWWALGDVIGRSWSALIVGGGWVVIAAILAVVGRKKLQEIKGLPQTTDSLKQIPAAVKGHEENNR